MSLEGAEEWPPGGSDLLLVCSDSELLVFDLRQILRHAALNVGGTLSVDPLQKASWGRTFFPRAMDCSKVREGFLRTGKESLFFPFSESPALSTMSVCQVPCGSSGGYLVALGLDEDSSVADSDSDSEEDAGNACGSCGTRSSSSRGAFYAGGENSSLESRFLTSSQPSGRPPKKRVKRSKAFLFKTPGYEELQHLRMNVSQSQPQLSPSVEGSISRAMLCVADLSGKTETK